MNAIPAQVVAIDGGDAALAFAEGRTLLLGNPGGKLAVGDAVTIGIRPEHCDVVDSGAIDLEVAINLIEQLGGETFFIVPRRASQDSRRRSRANCCARGDTLKLRFRRNHLHLFDAKGQALAHGATAAIAS
jgi:multiple sugar transport system ATP-binding protein